MHNGYSDVDIATTFVFDPSVVPMTPEPKSAMDVKSDVKKQRKMPPKKSKDDKKKKDPKKVKKITKKVKITKN